MFLTWRAYVPTYFRHGVFNLNILCVLVHLKQVESNSTNSHLLLLLHCSCTAVLHTGWWRQLRWLTTKVRNRFSKSVVKISISKTSYIEFVDNLLQISVVIKGKCKAVFYKWCCSSFCISDGWITNSYIHNSSSYRRRRGETFRGEAETPAFLRVYL